MHSHLNPASHYPRVFIEAAAHTSDSRLRTLAALAFVYSTVRFVEAYGLWKMRAWAELSAIISGCVYLPVELYELIEEAHAHTRGDSDTERARRRISSIRTLLAHGPLGRGRDTPHGGREQKSGGRRGRRVRKREGTTSQ